MKEHHYYIDVDVYLYHADTGETYNNMCWFYGFLDRRLVSQ